MTHKPPYLTSSTLVEAVRRRCSLPEADNYYDNDSILEFANEEMLESILPMIKATHEEYFIWNINVPLQSGILKYEIPERAIGSSLRDISYIDVGGSESEMTRIQRDDRYNATYTSTSSPYRFYVENNDIVLASNSGSNFSGYLKMTFLLRPNMLVESKYVSKIQNVVPSSLVISSITVGNPTIITTSSAHFIVNNETISISGVSGVGSGNVNDEHVATVVDTNSISINLNTTGNGPFTGGVLHNNTSLITLNVVPSDFSTSAALDVLKTKSPHTTLAFDVYPKSINMATKSVIFKTMDLPERLSQGDTIACANETDIPGIPTELHRLLVSKVCERVMDALGDQAGMMSAAKKSNESANAAQNYLENRVTSAPLKVKNSKGFLSRRNKNTRRF